MLQRPALLPWRSVLDNVLLPIEVFVGAAREHLDHAHELLSMVGLDGIQRRLPHELSADAAAGRAVPLADPTAAGHVDGRAVLGARRAHPRRTVGGTAANTHGALVDGRVRHTLHRRGRPARDRVIVLSPRPGHIQERSSTSTFPRPRSLGPLPHREQIARASAELHGLLLTTLTAYGAMAYSCAGWTHGSLGSTPTSCSDAVSGRVVQQ